MKYTQIIILKTNLHKQLLVLAFSFFITSNAIAGSRANKQNNRESYIQSDTNAIIRKISNSIYNTYYDPVFWKKNDQAIFTVLKIEINNIGEVRDMRFSDSADSAFTNALIKSINNQKFKSAIADLAKFRNYKNVSILIPIYYEPKFDLHPSVDYNHIELMLKFNKVGITGNSVLLKPVTIRVLSKGNS